MTPFQHRLMQTDVNDLCATARTAWRHAPGARRRVAFVWRHKRFVARHTSFRLVIDETNGRPVACCWE